MEILSPYLHRLFNACLQLGYHPRHFKESITVVLRKPGKDDYAQPKSYRPIALLNTLGKVLEAVIATRLSYLADTYQLLPARHTGGRKLSSTDHAIHLSKHHFYITLEEDLTPILIDESRNGTTVKYDGEAPGSARSEGKWVLALDPGRGKHWKEVIIQLPGFALRVDFPNHDSTLTSYMTHLRSFMSTRQEALPPLACLGINSSNTTVSNTPQSLRDKGADPLYINDRLIGKGAFGLVHRVIDLQTGGFFAMKRLKKRGNIRREVDMMGRYPHRNIAPVLFYTEDPKTFMVMPYYELGNLAELDATDQHYIHAFCDTLAGIAHLHSHGIIHRDLKAENILVDSPFRAILSDFGFARELPEQPLTSFLGTYNTIAPEVIPPLKDEERQLGYDESSDIWSLGVTFLCLLYRFPEIDNAALKVSLSKQKELCRKCQRKAEEYVEDLDEEEDLSAAILQHMVKIAPSKRLRAQECLDLGCKLSLFEYDQNSKDYEVAEKFRILQISPASHIDE